MTKSPQPGVEHPLLTFAEAAALLRVSKRTIERWVDAGRIPVVVLSERVKRIRRSDLRVLVHDCTSLDGAIAHVI